MKTAMTTQSIAKKISTRIIPLTLVVSGFALISAGAFILFPSTLQTSPKKQSIKPPPSIEHLTVTLKTAVQQYWQSNPADQAVQLPKLVARAKQRKALMTALLKSDPGKFIELSLPQGLTLSLPSEIQTNLELHTVREGVLEIVHQDFFDENRSTNETYLVTDGGKRFELRFTGSGDGLRSGARSTVTGVEIDSTIVVDSEAFGSTVVEDTSVSSPAVEKKMIVVLFDIPSNPLSSDHDLYRRRIFTDPDSVNAYYQEASYGKVTFVGKVNPQGDIVGPITLNHPSGCSYNYWQEAQQQAVASGVDFSGYDYQLWIGWQSTTCGASPPGVALGAKSYVRGLNIYTATHETGHMIGTGHAGGLNNNEYSDSFDVMGSGFKHMNTARKAQLGWYGPGEMKTVNSSGPDTLYPVEEPGAQTKGLKIYAGWYAGGPQYFYLEYRHPFGQYFDNFVASDPVVNGVSIRQAPESSPPSWNAFWQTWLIDAPPETDHITFGDAALPVGRTYTNTASGFEVMTTAISPDQSSATVYITLTCVRSNPIVSSIPNSLWAKPGESKTYQLTIRNNDNPACGASTFSVAPTNLLAGWTQLPAQKTVTILPLQIATLDVTITSPTSPLPADNWYAITQRATNQGATSYKWDASLSYRIDTVAPVVTITSPADGSKLAGPSTQTIQATTVDANIVSSREIFIDNISVRRCTTGPTQPCVYDWDISAAPFGLHRIRYEAQDQAGNVGSQIITVDVLGAGGGGGLVCGEDQGLPPCPMELQ